MRSGTQLGEELDIGVATSQTKDCMAMTDQVFGQGAADEVASCGTLYVLLRFRVLKPFLDAALW